MIRLTSPSRDMLAVCAVALLCLMSVSHSAPLDCKDLVEPMHPLDPRQFEGTWTLVADSLRIIEGTLPPQHSDSTSIEFYNSTFIEANRFGNLCHYRCQNVSIDGPNFHYKAGPGFHFNGTLYKTSCADCVMLSFNTDTPHYKIKELCLFSKRREVDQKEMEEFSAQVKCLKMPRHTVMDPTKELCPVHSNCS